MTLRQIKDQHTEFNWLRDSIPIEYNWLEVVQISLSAKHAVFVGRNSVSVMGIKRSSYPVSLSTPFNGFSMRRFKEVVALGLPLLVREALCPEALQYLLASGATIDFSHPVQEEGLRQ